MKKICTLCLIHEHPRILLGVKKRGFGMGKWNGFGGKVQPGEDLKTAAHREVFEEVGLEVVRSEFIGTIDFEFQNNPEIMQVNYFRIHEYKGEPSESEEMKPQWFDVKDIPFDKMWLDDIHWMPLFLAGKKFNGHCLYDESGKEILKFDIKEA